MIWYNMVFIFREVIDNCFTEYNQFYMRTIKKTIAKITFTTTLQYKACVEKQTVSRSQLHI